jgi:hydroxyacylglutathione hydrolase
VIFKQYRYEPLGQASYLIGCTRAREAAVVDPIADLGAEHYALEAADFGLIITRVLETHVHADFISCARELAAMTGAPHHLHESAPVRYPFQPLRDGQVLELGRIGIEVLHTPGHTPEHCCYLVTDRSRGSEPWFLLTGDSLFVGDVGRPDLLLGDPEADVMGQEERARALFRSLRERLLQLPDWVEVYPAHYGGSSCGGVNMSGKPSSTIRFERHHNLALGQPDEAAFARFVAESLRAMPEDYRRIKSINLGLVERPEAAVR